MGSRRLVGRACVVSRLDRRHQLGPSLGERRIAGSSGPPRALHFDQLSKESITSVAGFLWPFVGPGAAPAQDYREHQSRHQYCRDGLARAPRVGRPDTVMLRTPLRGTLASWKTWIRAPRSSVWEAMACRPGAASVR